MKTSVSISLLLFLAMVNSFAQDDSKTVDDLLGLRVVRNGLDYIIYTEQSFNINPNDYRKINYKVYFRIVSYDQITGPNGKSYQLITIPNTRKILNQNEKLNKSSKSIRPGSLVSKADFDHNFWIEVDIIEKYTQKEYYKWTNGHYPEKCVN